MEYYNQPTAAVKSNLNVIQSAKTGFDSFGWRLAAPLKRRRQSTSRYPHFSQTCKWANAKNHLLITRFSKSIDDGTGWKCTQQKNTQKNGRKKTHQFRSIFTRRFYHLAMFQWDVGPTYIFIIWMWIYQYAKLGVWQSLEMAGRKRLLHSGARWRLR